MTTEPDPIESNYSRLDIATHDLERIRKAIKNTPFRSVAKQLRQMEKTYAYFIGRFGRPRPEKKTHRQRLIEDLQEGATAPASE